MDPRDTSYHPGSDLPTPQFGASNVNSPDDSTSRLPNPANSTAAGPDLAGPNTAQNSQIIPPPIPDGSGASPSPTPAAADDSDLIEQEWVNKAKAIVERTKTDPHIQNQEINKIKADYIKKRYNREVKASEDWSWAPF